MAGDGYALAMLFSFLLGSLSVPVCARFCLIVAVCVFVCLSGFLFGFVCLFVCLLARSLACWFVCSFVRLLVGWLVGWLVLFVVCMFDHFPFRWSFGSLCCLRPQVKAYAWHTSQKTEGPSFCI